MVSIMKMNKEILRLSLPNIISNITVPLLGMVDLAIIGSLNDYNLIATIGIGIAVFNLLYWNFGFLRMSTSGFTAQAYGANNLEETGIILARGFLLSVSIALVFLLLQNPLIKLSLYVLNTTPENYALVLRYYKIRIWAAPATLSLFVTSGWFIGMQNAKIPMFIAIIMNVVNLVLSYVFAIILQMGIAGIAMGTLIAQYLGLILSVGIIIKRYKYILTQIPYVTAFHWDKMKRFFAVNSDIFLRSIALCFVFTFFTSASALLGNEILSLNTVFMQLFIFYSYFMDGFANAAEALVGRFVGANDTNKLRETILKINLWGLGSAIVFSAIYYFGLSPIIRLFFNEVAILQLAEAHKLLIVLVPPLSFLAFVYDGIMIGSTRSKEMRNTMFIACIAFTVLYYSLINVFGNTALWIAFLAFLFLRGFLLLLCSKRNE